MKLNINCSSYILIKKICINFLVYCNYQINRTYSNKLCLSLYAMVIIIVKIFSIDPNIQYYRKQILSSYKKNGIEWMERFCNP